MYASPWAGPLFLTQKRYEKYLKNLNNIYHTKASDNKVYVNTDKTNVSDNK